MKNRITFMLLLISTFALAKGEQGTCWSMLGGTVNQFTYIDNFNDGDKGESSTGYWGGLQHGFECKTIISEPPVLYEFFAMAKMQLPLSNINNGYYKLSEDIDVLVTSSESSVQNMLNGPYIALPFKDKAVGLENSSSLHGIVLGIANYNAGKIIYKLRRDIIGGVVIVPPDITILHIYYSYRKKGTKDPIIYGEPTISFVTKAQFSSAPTACQINNNNIINVLFGDINSALLSTDGNGISKKIPLNITCNKNIGENVAIQLVADRSDFSSELVKTNKSNLGIMIKHNNNVIKPWSSIPVRMNDKHANTEIEASLVKNTVQKPETGDFLGSATLILTLP